MLHDTVYWRTNMIPLPPNSCNYDDFTCAKSISCIHDSWTSRSLFSSATLPARTAVCGELILPWVCLWAFFMTWGPTAVMCLLTGPTNTVIVYHLYVWNCSCLTEFELWLCLMVKLCPWKISNFLILFPLPTLEQYNFPQVRDKVYYPQDQSDIF